MIVWQKFVPDVNLSLHLEHLHYQVRAQDICTIAPLESIICAQEMGVCNGWSDAVIAQD